MSAPTSRRCLRDNAEMVPAALSLRLWAYPGHRRAPFFGFFPDRHRVVGYVCPACGALELTVPGAHGPASSPTRPTT